ncbi:hypothetical protein [Novilysobacter spongiicola]|uniref:DUF4142 domain-containing protein n=1 Tax=Lysobacter spongiicola DSM 21749 TaxID=1122188 RepID=A0A1T4NBY1_9GAMM|nr:hypothetical protein [Lysobacter spongiicola]SJZ76625.1 hypothetical protein SAMN02745674_00820 [Lysobacter spongiicola DSM 21749]
MKKIATALTVILAASASLPAHAQLGKLFGKNADPAQAAAAPSADSLIVSFSQSQALLINAQSTLGEALGLKDQLAEAQATQQAMASGQLDHDAMKKTREYSEAMQAAIDQAMEDQPELSVEARAKFTEGLVGYLAALAGARHLVGEASAFTSSATSNPLMLIGQARSALYVGKEIPGYVKNLGTTTRSLLAYAKRNNIEAPENATAALDGL